MTKDDLRLYVESSKRDCNSFEELLARLRLIADESYQTASGDRNTFLFHVKQATCIASFDKSSGIRAWVV